MTATHYLVTDSTAEEIERKTGLRGHPTPLGILVKKPKPFRLEIEMEKFDRIFHPRRCQCRGIIHICQFAFT